MFAYVVILAGGSGTRLWPASTAARPKQFMVLADGTTFFDRALERAFALEPERGVLIVTGASQTEAAVRACGALPPGIPGRGSIRVLPEPAGRNTAPAAALAVAAAGSWGGRPDDTFLLMTSDHLIEPISSFVRDARSAEKLASEENLVCFGIPPRHAATGFGYIEAAGPLGPGFRAAAFREKPDSAAAERFLAAGNFYWNSGMYAFRADFLSRELARHAPAVQAAFVSLRGKPRELDQGGVRVLEGWDGLDEAYAGLPSISLDYAVSERCRSVALVPATFSWDDVGSWDDMARLFPAGSGEVFSVESTDCFVDSDIPVALCGVSGLAVVIRGGAALVLRRGTSQLVKDAVDLAGKSGRRDIL